MIRDASVAISETTRTAPVSLPWAGVSWSCVLILSLLAGEIARVQAAQETAKSLAGAWKLSRQSPDEGEWATLELRLLENKLIVEQVDVPLMAGLNPTRGYVEHSDDALVVVLTNGYTDLVFKARLSRDGNPDRIEGPNRLQSVLFAVTPTWMADWRECRSSGRRRCAKTLKGRNPRRGWAEVW